MNGHLVPYLNTCKYNIFGDKKQENWENSEKNRCENYNKAMF